MHDFEDDTPTPPQGVPELPPRRQGESLKSWGRRIAGDRERDRGFVASIFTHVEKASTWFKALTTVVAGIGTISALVIWVWTHTASGLTNALHRAGFATSEDVRAATDTVAKAQRESVLKCTINATEWLSLQLQASAARHKNEWYTDCFSYQVRGKPRERCPQEVPPTLFTDLALPTLKDLSP